MIDFEKYKSRTKEDAEKSVIIGSLYPPGGACVTSSAIINQSADPVAKLKPADYDDHSHAPGRQELWMTSTPVILMVEYLRKYKDQGATLHARGDVLGMRFRPGINAAQLNGERGQIAANMCNLLTNAAKDIRAMIKQGIKIPLLINHPERKA